MVQGNVKMVHTMPGAAHIESQIALINRYIARLDNESTRLRSERSIINRAVRKTYRHIGYFRFIRWLRSPEKYFELWTIAVLAVGPVIFGGILTVVAYMLVAWLPLAFFAFLFGAVVSAGTLWNLLRYPDSRSLDSGIANAARELHVGKEKKKQISKRLEAVKKALTVRHDQRHELMSSAQYQREQLLQRNWKAMRDTEWEEYLAEICRALGGTVEMTKTVGDQGVDLIVQYGPKRIAVQAKGYHNSVSNSAVQQVVAGMVLYGCNACAVITNSRFTASAKELAASNGCVLISEDDFPGFVMGNTSL